MEHHELWLDDVSNNDIGVELQGALVISAPEPRVQTISVPGRNGDLHIYDGSYKNRTGTVGAYVYRPEYVKSAFGSIQKWLLGSQGYRRLTTNDDADHYMMARVVNGAEVAARMQKIAPFTLAFDLMPQRFLTSGEQAIEVTGNITLRNPTEYTSKPIYVIKGSGNVQISVNGSTLNFEGLATPNYYSDIVYYDTETKSAYVPQGSALTVLPPTVSGELHLVGGENAISLTGDIEYVQIIPRWWEL